MRMVKIFVVVSVNARLRQGVFASALSAGNRLALGGFRGLLECFGQSRVGSRYSGRA